MSKGAPAMSYSKAQKLRHQMTEAETMFWQSVRQNKFNGLKFRRQHPVSIYILDFYCHQYKLGVELDGGYHTNPKQMELDVQRDRNLMDQGLRILRFSNEHVLKNVKEVLEKIEEEIKQITGGSDPL